MCYATKSSRIRYAVAFHEEICYRRQSRLSTGYSRGPPDGVGQCADHDKTAKWCPADCVGVVTGVHGSGVKGR